MDDERDIEIDETDETEVDELTENLEAEASAEAVPAPKVEAAPVDAAPLQRVFKIGGTRITENDVTLGKSIDEVKAVLKGSYPEVTNATVREVKDKGVHLFEFLPQPGRKG